MSQQQHGHDQGHHEEHKHFIMPTSMAIKIWLALLLGTFITVAVSRFDFGAFNFFIAMLVASIKAALVCLFFMGLKYDKKESSVIFFTSFLFVAIYFILTGADLLTRNEPKTLPPIVSTMNAPSKFKKPWNETAEIKAHGKVIFEQQCVMCHGVTGEGNGPAAGGLNPKPRNFTQATGWKNGHKSTEIFTTLTKGLNSMPAFGSLPAEDRWSLVHYVTAFGPASEKASAADFAKLGIDPNKEDAGGGAEKSISVDQAIEAIATDGKKSN
jgi:cytochrome c oxidase subunit IV